MEGVHPEVIRRLVETNLEQTPLYGGALSADRPPSHRNGPETQGGLPGKGLPTAHRFADQSAVLRPAERRDRAVEPICHLRIMGPARRTGIRHPLRHQLGNRRAADRRTGGPALIRLTPRTAENQPVSGIRAFCRLCRKTTRPVLFAVFPNTRNTPFGTPHQTFGTILPKISSE